MHFSFVPSVLLDLFFPKKCIGCRKEGKYFCDECISDILQTDLICPQCGNLSIGGLTHPSCEREFSLDGLWSLGIYQGSLKRLIQKLKYEPSLVRDFAPVLADLISDYWVKYQPFIYSEIQKDKKWVVTSVPLYWFKENKRGFNQSKVIGQILSKKLNLDYSDVLKRVRYTASQVGLRKRARKENIKEAFSVDGDLSEQNILLIDDVWTTGSTLKECCYALKKAGAKRVWAITLAR